MMLRSLWDRIRSGDAAMLAYWLWVRWHRLDLHAASLDQLGLSRETAQPYINSGGPDLLRAFRQIPVGPQDRILDIGCGKGGACLTLAELPFAEVVGVDLCAPLIQAAQHNARKLGLEPPRVSFECADALAVDLTRFSHLYLFNPFPAPVVAQFMRRVRWSLIRHPRRLTIVFRNPSPAMHGSGFALARTITLPHVHPTAVYFFAPSSSMPSRQLDGTE